MSFGGQKDIKLWAGNQKARLHDMWFCKVQCTNLLVIRKNSQKDVNNVQWQPLQV